MHIKIVVIVFVLFILSGCHEQLADPLAPEPPALSSDFTVFTPPAVTENTDPSIATADPNEFTNLKGVITLQQALALALMQNPGLKSYSWQVRSAQADKLQASLKPNPEFSVYIEDFGGSGDLRGFEGYESSYLFSQLIEVGGKRKKRYAVASLEKKIAEWDYRAKRLEVFTDVISAFNDVLSAQQRLELDIELLRLSEDIVRTVAERVRAGKDPPLDEKKARIVLAEISILYRQAKNNLDFARTRLASLWSSVPMFTKASGNLTVPKRIVSLNDLLPFLSSNPQLSASAAEIERAQADLQLEKARSKQDVTIGGGIKRIGQNDTAAFVLSLTVPIGITDRNQGNRRRAVCQLARARQQQRQLNDRLRTELADQYNQMANAYSAAIEYDESIIPAARAVFEASKKSYPAGSIDYLDMLNSQKILFMSLSGLVKSQSDYNKSKAQIERIIARPIEIPDDAEKPSHK